MGNEHTTDGLDIVYVVRPGDDNEALRYSLRSICANLPHRNVIIAGHRPSWVNPDTTVWIERRQEEYPDLSNSNYNMLAAVFNWSPLSHDFILFNDDFIVMEPLTALENNHQGSLEAVIQRYTKTVMLQAYSLKKTSIELVKLGVMPPYYSYELHTPFVYNKHKLAELFTKLAGPDPYGNPQVEMFSIRPRSLYGNYYKIGGKEVADVKYPEPVRPLWSAPTDVIGASEGSRGARAEVETGTATSVLRRAFPRRCKYELPESVQVSERQDYDDQERSHSSSPSQKSRVGGRSTSVRATS